MLLDAIIKMSRKRLTRKQKIVLERVSRLERDVTMSTLLRELSQELDMGESTARIVLQTLRDVDLIVCGDQENKGVAVRLTEIGEKVVEGLNGS